MIVSDFQKIATTVAAGQGKKTQAPEEAASDAFAALLGLLMNSVTGDGSLSHSTEPSDAVTSVTGDGSLSQSGMSALMEALGGQGSIEKPKLAGTDVTGDGSLAQSGISELMEALGGQGSIEKPKLDVPGIDKSGMPPNIMGDLKITEPDARSQDAKAQVQLQDQVVGLNLEAQPKVEQANVENQPGATISPGQNDGSKTPKSAQNLEQSSKNEVKIPNQYEVKGGNEAKNEIEQYVIPKFNIIKILKDSQSQQSPKAEENQKDGQKDIVKLELPANGTDKAKGSGAEKESTSQGETDEKGAQSLKKQDNTFQGALQDRVAFQSKSEALQDVAKQGTTINKEDVITQVFDRIKVVNLKDTSEISFSLRPEELGHVAIKLVMEKGMMTGRIMVENSQVKSLIESSLPQVKEQLKNQNINVSEINVSVGLEHGSFGGSQGNAEGRWAFNRKGFNRGQSINAASEIAVQRAVSQSGSLNLLA